MVKRLLAVDSNVNNFNRHQSTWSSQGIEPIRVSSMQEAVQALAKDEYIFVLINGDSINYKPMLKIMRDIVDSNNVPTPIQIYTSHPTFEEQIEVIKLGADHYLNRREDTKETTLLSLAIYHRYVESLQAKQNVKFYSYMEVSVYPNYRKAFIRDQEICLTPIEFDLLILLISNQKRVYEIQKIIQKVWGYDTDIDNSALRNAIMHLRKKLRVYSDMPQYINSVYKIGYAFDR